MSAWLSGGFNQITDQITSFTKEVLTETTEEVVDPVGELEALRHKYKELLKSQEYQQSEFDKLKLHCEEQKDRAETAECQIATISQEYRKLISTRDAEIRRLKTDNETLRDQTKSVDDTSPLKELALGVGTQALGPEKGGVVENEAYESVDMGEDLEWAGLQYGDSFLTSIDPHTEMSRMKQEMASLRAELQQAKEKLKTELEDHSSDMARLKISHQNNIETLQKQQQRQVCQLQQQLETVTQSTQQQPQEDGGTRNSGGGSSHYMPSQELEGMSEPQDDGCASLREELHEAKQTLQHNKLLLKQLLEERAAETSARATLEQQHAAVVQNLSAARDELSKARAEVVLLTQDKTQLQAKVQTLEEKKFNELRVTSVESSETIRQLKSEVARISEERDDAILRMSNANQQAQQNAESMRNLQTALEHLQRDQSSELSEALKRSQLELSASVAECDHVRAQYDEVCVELEEANAGARAAALLSQELDDKETLIAQLKGQVTKLQQDLTEVAQTSRDSRQLAVDRSLMKNLVLGYVHASEPKKVEVLQLIAKILEFSAPELEQACRVHRKGWLGGLWKTSTASSDQRESNSLSSTFVHFLEAESGPKVVPPPATGSTSTTSTISHSGYIDPLTDPDRPSLSTVSLLGPSKQELKPSNESKSDSTNSQQNHFQSTLLKNVLS